MSENFLTQNFKMCNFFMHENFPNYGSYMQTYIGTANLSVFGTRSGSPQFIQFYHALTTHEQMRAGTRQKKAGRFP